MFKYTNTIYITVETTSGICIKVIFSYIGFIYSGYEVRTEGNCSVGGYYASAKPARC